MSTLFIHWPIGTLLLAIGLALLAIGLALLVVLVFTRQSAPVIAAAATVVLTLAGTFVPI